MVNFFIIELFNVTQIAAVSTKHVVLIDISGRVDFCMCYTHIQKSTLPEISICVSVILNHSTSKTHAIRGKPSHIRCVNVN